VNDARDLYKDFTGHDATHGQKVKVRVPAAALKVGSLDGVLYTTVRDGRTEKYIHKFRKASRPVLAAGSDGKSLHVIGGEFEFTERGIVDR
jgi:hypothetical protein